MVNGASNWIGIGGYGIQPSEVVKIFIIPIYAWYYDTDKKYSVKNPKMWIPVIFSVIVASFIVLQNDFGTAFIFLLLSVIMFFLTCKSKEAKKILFLVGLAGTILLAFALLTFGNKLIDQDKIDRFNSLILVIDI